MRPRLAEKRPEQLDRETEQLVSLARYIHEHADEKLPLAHLAEVSGMSASRLQKTFKRTLGVSPKQFGKEYEERIRLRNELRERFISR